MTWSQSARLETGPLYQPMAPEVPEKDLLLHGLGIVFFKLTEERRARAHGARGGLAASGRERAAEAGQVRPGILAKGRRRKRTHGTLLRSCVKSAVAFGFGWLEEKHAEANHFGAVSSCHAYPFCGNGHQEREV